MEQDFQTSFIPKKPMIEERAVASRPTGLFTVISIFVFFAVVLASAGFYFYDGVMKKNIIDLENNLNLAKNRFEPSEISKFQILDKRLSASNIILSNHIAISSIFESLGQTTLKSIRYTKFSYDFGSDSNAKVEVKMSGQTTGYQPIAQQSDLFAQNKSIIDPVFSNLSLDDKGNVLFDLDFSVDPSFVNYKQLLATESTNPSTTTVDNSSGSTN